VNVTSPAVVEVNALAMALGHNKIAGAAMDVYDSHPIAPNSPLLGLSNMVLTPHIGGATVESIDRHSSMVVEDIQRFVAGKRPKRLANPAVWRRRRR
jgi:phosphoglycerate dehydrogenase-like enzyme